MNTSFLQRLHITIYGAVQGVGFRPFVYRLATELGLSGWVQNSAEGVVIEVEGAHTLIDLFRHRLEHEKPSQALIQAITYSWLSVSGDKAFAIRASTAGKKMTLVLPDVATCSDCRQEIFDPSNRRYRYPFTNCTNCGPRFSIIEALPYDRSNTTMRSFQMCQHCQVEYDNPSDRRFHAQPNACPLCGPHLELWDLTSKVVASHENALRMAAETIRQGKIVAVKGIGGFHIMVDARNEDAIQRLRQAKCRAAKPFALMYPSLELIKLHCEVSELEEKVLLSPAAPIVLLQRVKIQNSKFNIAPSVAPNNPYLGIMLPYTPLHHLLLHDLGFPIIATSGNLADVPICTNEQEAIQNLSSIVDLLLVHHRAIARPVDDSVVRVLLGQVSVLRRARGYAPLPIQNQQNAKIHNSQPIVLALGAHLKNTVAFLKGQQIFVSQHLGNLATILAFKAFQQAIASFQQLYELQPTAIACDLHPDYHSTHFAHQLAKQLNIPVFPVQHHYAHALSCMAEHQLEGSVLGIVWDGTGYGLDQTIWGGEFLHITQMTCKRVAHLRPFHLPGGSKAVKEPRRSAIGILYDVFGRRVFERPELATLQSFSCLEQKILQGMLEKQLNTPISSSAGRLFDAIASIIKLRQQTQFEGQAAMELEFAIDGDNTNQSYAFEILETTGIKQPRILNWTAMVKAILADVDTKTSNQQIAIKFHNTLVEMMVAIAQQVGEEQVVLTGGCFQNQYLTQRAVARLRAEGFCPYWHQRIPANDGGIAVGQILAVLRELSSGEQQCV